MPVKATIQNDTLIFQLPEKLTMTSTLSFQHEIFDKLKAQATNVVVDLSRVYLADTSGLSIIVSMYKFVNQYGGRITLHSPRPNVASLMSMVRLDELLDIHPNETSALAALPVTH